ncbi:hypothetical protein GMORB2_1122 [Geosmithia morbida]|uniref:Threonine aspartase n=1 Tax=Geosmithia morbida TaxID=1094350 RepID=A0A9P4Z1V2_9HYPO|nr:uncharacterized protein GMORB2_1122 [Geosmithia morbida]KAF4125876.1 hypothetical protein GMORB2_1122 [Geosmithia morbida]
MADSPHGTDGTIGKILRFRKPKCTPAIFIHAGAGFHSPQNERIHLEACASASEMGMRFLKAGSSAIESVEAALKVLEDKEITNAGYGSNLSIDGIVECDATVVDHLGRSGACGAVPGVRNPISLAKTILDTSNKPLSLRRVPPNALVGEGAKKFAEENGIVTCSNEQLVSKNARDRFIRWQMDLNRVESNSDPRMLPTVDQGHIARSRHLLDNASPLHASDLPFRPDHSAAILAATWNEGQPGSPNCAAQELSAPGGSITPGALPQRTHPKIWSRLEINEPSIPGDNSIVPSSHSLQSGSTQLPTLEPMANRTTGEADTAQHHRATSTPECMRHNSQWDRAQNGPPSLESHIPTSQGIKRPHSQMGGDEEEPGQPSWIIAPPFLTREDGEDVITDTIGAITVDENGHIAAGSSSGGIGMKHRGRLGPAALVGVGTAVIPCDKDDEDQVSVAVVTSGTGEHMVTTMASQRCAERIYYGTRKGQDGEDIREDDEDAIMESFVVNDFMNHPGVKNCHSAAAIGAMAVKKTPRGYYLYFAHNTDSFALASMSGFDKQPVCTMSRLPQGGKIAKGGLRISVD